MGPKVPQSSVPSSSCSTAACRRTTMAASLSSGTKRMGWPTRTSMVPEQNQQHLCRSSTRPGRKWPPAAPWLPTAWPAGRFHRRRAREPLALFGAVCAFRKDQHVEAAVHGLAGVGKAGLEISQPGQGKDIEERGQRQPGQRLGTKSEKRPLSGSQGDGGSPRASRRTWPRLFSAGGARAKSMDQQAMRRR